ncbi:MAG: hypothetical protein AAGG53_10905 [Cyanobacteria bacterium P01_H01_bin.152]
MAQSRCSGTVAVQWHSRGAVATTQLPTATAVSLTEDSPLLSQLSQTFIVPEDLDQRFLTFDLIDTTLGSSVISRSRVPSTRHYW